MWVFENVFVIYTAPYVKAKIVPCLDRIHSQLIQGTGSYYLQREYIGRTYERAILRLIRICCGREALVIKGVGPARYADLPAYLVGRGLSHRSNTDATRGSFPNLKVLYAGWRGKSISTHLPFLGVSSSQPLLASVPSSKSRRDSGKYHESEYQIFKPVFGFALEGCAIFGGGCLLRSNVRNHDDRFPCARFASSPMYHGRARRAIPGQSTAARYW